MSYMLAAYIVVWIGIFLYVMSIGRRQVRLQAEVRELKELAARRKR